MAIYKNDEVTVISEPSDETGKWKIRLKDGTSDAVPQGELKFTDAEAKQYTDRKIAEVKNSINTATSEDIKKAKKLHEAKVEQDKDKFGPKAPVQVK